MDNAMGQGEQVIVMVVIVAAAAVVCVCECVRVWHPHVCVFGGLTGRLGLELLLYKLTIEAQKRVEESGLSKREITRRLGTSATQFYRILDQTNYRKSVDQVLNLLHVLECDVDLVVRAKSA